MPKIPNDSPQISLNVPGVNAPYTREFGKVGTSVESLGDTLENNVVDLGQQVTHLQAVTTAATAYASAKVDSENKLAQLKVMSPDGLMHDEDGNVMQMQNGDGTTRDRTITDEYHEWADQRYRTDQDSMNGVAAQMYREQSLPLFSSHTASLIDETHQMQYEASGVALDKMVQTFGNQLSNNPDVDELYKNYASMTDNIDKLTGAGGIYNGTQAAGLKKKYGQMLGRDTLKGAYDQVSEMKRTDQAYVPAVMAALTRIRGQDVKSKFYEQNGMPTLSNMMDPIQRDIEEKRLIGLLPMAQARDKENFNVEYEQSVAAARAGKLPTEDYTQMLGRLVNQATNEPKEAAPNAIKYATLAAAKEQGRYADPAYQLSSVATMMQDSSHMEELAKKSAGQAAQMFGLTYTSAMGQTVADAIHDQMVKGVSQAASELREDLAKTMMAPRPEFDGRSPVPSGAKLYGLNYTNIPGLVLNGGPQAYQQFKSSYDFYANHNMGDHPEDHRSPMTKPQLQIIADGLMHTGSEEQGGQSVQALTQFWGSDYRRNIEQTIKDKSAPESARILALHATDNNSQSLRLMMAAYRGSDAYNEQFEKSASVLNGDTSSKELNQKVAEQFDGYITSQSQSHPLSGDTAKMMNDIRSMGRTATQIIFNGQQNKDIGAAAKQAYKMLIGDFIHKSVNGGYFSGYTGTDSYPTQIGNAHIGQVESDNIEINKQKYSNVDEIRALNPSVPRKSDGTPSDFADKFPEMVARTVDPHFSENNGNPGWRIFYTDNRGQRQTLLTRNAQGVEVPAIIPAEKMMKPHIQGLFERGENAVSGALGKVGDQVGKSLPGIVKAFHAPLNFNNKGR